MKLQRRLLNSTTAPNSHIQYLSTFHMHHESRSPQGNLEFCYHTNIVKATVCTCICVCLLHLNQLKRGYFCIPENPWSPTDLGKTEIHAAELRATPILVAISRCTRGSKETGLRRLLPGPKGALCCNLHFSVILSHVQRDTAASLY